MTQMVPTPQQAAVFTEIAGSQRHLIVEAVAGAGKTSVAVGSLHQNVPGRKGFVAFNRHIATELQRRLPPDIRSCTLHSLGFAAVRRVWKGVEVDEMRIRNLSKKCKSRDMPFMDVIAAQELARLCKCTLVLEASDQPCTCEAFFCTCVTTERRRDRIYYDLADHYGVDLPSNPEGVFELTTKLMEASADKSDKIDYTDMLWLPIRHNMHVENYDLLLVDELQDLSRVMQQLALRSCNGGRFVGVGDRRQAILGFSGADCDSMPRLQGELTSSSRSCASLPLSVTFRCPVSHVKLAQQIVPQIEPAPNAIEGIIRTAEQPEIIQSLLPGDLVVSRTNKALVSLTFKLIASGKRALMRGRDIGSGMLDLLARLQPQSTVDLITRLNDWREKEELKLREREASPSSFQSLEDRYECLSTLTSQVKTLDELHRFIKQASAENASPEDCICLSSIHRAKGLEADRVFILDSGKLPFIRKDSLLWEIEQERNLVYVAVTRAKRELVFEGFIPPIFGA